MNSDDFPNPAPMDAIAEKDTGSQLPRVVPPQKELSAVVAILGGYSSLVSYLVSLMKRGSTQPMDIDEVDTASTPKKQKIDPRQQLVQKGHAKKKNVVKVR